MIFILTTKKASQGQSALNSIKKVKTTLFVKMNIFI